jgi:hypothetical protein
MFTDVSKVLAASIITVIMEVAGTSETSVKFYQITRHCENLKYHYNI